MARANPARELSATRPCRSAAGGKGNRVQQEVQPPPARAQGVEDGFHLPVLLHVQGQLDGGLQLLCQRLDVGAGLLVQPGDGQLGPSGAEGARAAPGNAVLVGNADDQPLFAVQIKNHAYFSNT